MSVTPVEIDGCVHLHIAVDVRQIVLWPQARIAAFFGGLAQAIAAQNDGEPAEEATPAPKEGE